MSFTTLFRSNIAGTVLKLQAVHYSASERCHCSSGVYVTMVESNDLEPFRRSECSVFNVSVQNLMMSAIVRFRALDFWSS